MKKSVIIAVGLLLGISMPDGARHSFAAEISDVNRTDKDIIGIFQEFKQEISTPTGKKSIVLGQLLWKFRHTDPKTLNQDTIHKLSGFLFDQSRMVDYMAASFFAHLGPAARVALPALRRRLQQEMESCWLEHAAERREYGFVLPYEGPPPLGDVLATAIRRIEAVPPIAPGTEHQAMECALQCTCDGT